MNLVYISGKNVKQTAAVCSMISIYINEKDYLITGNNDGVALIWELVVSEDKQAKPYLIRIINNTGNKYDDYNYVM